MPRSVPGAQHVLLMAAAGTKGCPDRDRDRPAMALQQPPLAPRAGPAPALYIHSMPAWVLEDFCQKMDCLSDYDWMRFGEEAWRRWGGAPRAGGTGTAAPLGRAGRRGLGAVPRASQRSAGHIQ